MDHSINYLILSVLYRLIDNDAIYFIMSVVLSRLGESLINFEHFGLILSPLNVKPSVVSQ